ncbi:MAG: hypothetical protein H8E35_00565, partial [Ardenticatenia bacterium]|nr:hypothetical protein [Ardenticatenia bacterium]
MALDSPFVQRLLAAADPLEVIWEEALALWRVESLPVDLVDFYNRQEEALSRLGEMLDHGYFEVYDLLLEQARQPDDGYGRERLHSDNVVIIADFLRLRG